MTRKLSPFVPPAKTRLKAAIISAFNSGLSCKRRLKRAMTSAMDFTLPDFTRRISSPSSCVGVCVCVAVEVDVDEGEEPRAGEERPDPGREEGGWVEDESVLRRLAEEPSFVALMLALALALALVEEEGTAPPGVVDAGDEVEVVVGEKATGGVCDDDEGEAGRFVPVVFVVEAPTEDPPLPPPPPPTSAPASGELCRGTCSRPGLGDREPAGEPERLPPGAVARLARLTWPCPGLWRLPEVLLLLFIVAPALRFCFVGVMSFLP